MKHPGSWGCLREGLGGRLCVEHDAGWVFAGRPDGPLVVSSYDDGDDFSGPAGLEALLDWLRP